MVVCCRWVFAGGDGQAIARAVTSVNWPRFVRTVRFHRVQGLVWKCLAQLGKAVPNEVATQFAADARSIAAANLQIAVASRELSAAFNQAGVALLFVKGLTVSGLAYGDPLLKMGWDIDLLIDPTQLEQAANVMRECGYHLIIPAAPERLGSWHLLRKDSGWASEAGIHIELHTRLTENRHVIPLINVRSPSRQVQIAPGIILPTLSHDELVTYLCVHGASSLWFRLKWITDLAAILHPLDQAEIARLHTRALELGAGRASAGALLLADRLYGTLGESPLRAKLLQERGGKWLYVAALRQLARRAEPREPTSVTGGTAAIHLSQLFLVPGAQFKLAEAVRQLRAALA